MAAAVMLFEMPRSFTGEDIAELHVPNSPALLSVLIEQLLKASREKGISVRLADPGEFSARAFFNHKIDLTQAEGLAATINASNESELRAAASLRQGDLHRQISAIADQLAHLLAMLEANIDFTDEEDIHLVDAQAMKGSLLRLDETLHFQIAHGARVDRLTSPPTIVFIGEPNVGKSSLVNVLAGADRSIVSPIPGTTRDMLAVVMHTEGGDVRLIDLPGQEPPIDELRHKMMAARDAALLESDLVVEVVTHATDAIGMRAMVRGFTPDTVIVQNKADLLPSDQSGTHEYAAKHGESMSAREGWQLVSAKTGFHIDLLRLELSRRAMAKSPVSAKVPALNHRHRQILQQTRGAVAQALQLIAPPSMPHPELLAAELRHALNLLGQISGTISPDEVLGRIFSQFCIGK